jgi:hypothetical protein
VDLMAFKCRTLKVNNILLFFIHQKQRNMSRRQAVLRLMCVDEASTIVLYRSFAIEYEQKCGVFKFREFTNSAPAMSKIRNCPQPQFNAGLNLHRYILFVCFPGVTTHCGCIFTAQ